MDEYTCISKKQYCILLSFALMLIVTTSSLQTFVGACAQVMVFCLINRVVFQKIENKRVCWGIFLILCALIGEGMLILTEKTSLNIPTSGFFLLPASTFLYLSAPMFGHYDDTHTISATEMGKGFLYYVICGVIISAIRELFGSATLWGREISWFSHIKVSCLGHTAGAAFLVLLSLLLIPSVFSNEEGGRYCLQTETGKAKKYSSIQLRTEKDFVKLSLCLLIYDLVFGALGAMVIEFAPKTLHQATHVVFFSSVTSIALFTLIIWIFKQTRTLDNYRFVPLLGVITTSMPMIYYMNYLSIGENGFLTARILWWIGLMIGVWITSVVIVTYTRVVKTRLLFGKQPRILEGMPFVILQVLLAIIVFMPWTSVLPAI